MSILFVLLTFLLILSYSYFRRNETPAVALQPAPFQKMTAPRMLKTAGFDVPEGYGFHLGHTWVRDEGQQNARIGIDGFAANLFGQVDSVEMADLNRWVRQGQKLCTVRKGAQSVEMLSPVEGVLVSVNHEVLKNPNLITEDPYKNGWLGVFARLSGMMQTINPALAQDGGLPVKGLYFQVDSTVQRKLAKEFFLS